MRGGARRPGLEQWNRTAALGEYGYEQDELYIVISGKGEFVKAGERRHFGPRDVIFIEASADHHFKHFSADFAAWVIFWGPDGGE